MLLASDAAKPVSVPLPVGDRAVDLYQQMIAADDMSTPVHPVPKSAEGQGTKPRGEKDFSVVYDFLMEKRVKAA